MKNALTAASLSKPGRPLIASVAAICALAALPFWAGPQYGRIFSEAYCYAALATLWNLLAGYAGLVSVGQQAFVGLGAYVLFAAVMFFGVHPLAAIAAAGAVTCMIAFPCAFLMFRLQGHYFAIGTWVLAEVFRLLASQVSALGGGSGTSLPARAMIAISADRNTREMLLYWTSMTIAVAILLLTFALLRSRWGLALTAMRDNGLAARSCGVGVRRLQFITYLTAAFGAGLVGALTFLQRLRISPDAAFSTNEWTAYVIFITVIGGIGRMEGPIVGTAIFILLRETLADFGSIYLIVLGLIAVAVMIGSPRGVCGMVSNRFGWKWFPLERRLNILS